MNMEQTINKKIQNIPALRFKEFDGEWEVKKLGEVCKITTGKLDANAMTINGRYRFYTCAKDYFLIDKFAFDTKALLISGNGANVGYIHYYEGKFNAYQRTYVLDKFDTVDILYTKFFLEKNLQKRIHTERNDGNTPYIILGTLSKMKILYPSLPEQQKIANFLSQLDEQIAQTQAQLAHLRDYKKGLLQQLFV